jgi:hypothetical protein
MRAAQLPAVVVVVVAVSVVGLAGHARAQSLGEVGRQEEQRRQNLKNPAKVYTNKDLNTPRGSVEEPVAGQPQQQPGAASAPPTAAAAAESPKPDGPLKDQKYWSGRKKEIDAKIERDRVLADAMQSRINGLTADFAARSDPAQRAVIERDRQRAVAELAGLQKSIKDDQKAVTDLDEEARKAGVPPGWLR